MPETDASAPAPTPRGFFHPEKPFAPRKLPFFYGWLLAPLAALGLLASMPGQTIGVGSFKEHLLEALSMEDEGSLTLAYLIGTIASGLIIPFVGRRIDKVGVRPMGFFVFIGFGLTLLFMAGAGELHALAGPGEGVAFTIVLVGYFFLRFLGQGLVSMLPMLMVQRWFNRLRGRVSGVFNAIAALGFSSAPLFLDAIIGAFGHQGAFIFLGLFMLLGMTSLAYLFYRDNPEQCGLEMDGGYVPKKPDSARTAARFTTYHDYTAGEAVRTLAFWFFALGLGFQSFTVTSVFFHRTTMVDELGITNADFGQLLVGAATVNIFMNLVIGWLTDRISLRYILVLQLVGTSLFMASLFAFPSALGTVLFIVGSGIAWGCFGVLQNVTWPRYFGRKNLGSINGIVLAIIVIASALGPHYYTLVKDAEGAYLAAVRYSFLWPALVACAFVFVRNPQLRHAPTEVRDGGDLRGT